MLRKGKPRQREQFGGGQGWQGGGDRDYAINGYRIFFWGDVIVLGLDRVGS